MHWPNCQNCHIFIVKLFLTRHLWSQLSWTHTKPTPISDYTTATIHCHKHSRNAKNIILFAFSVQYFHKSKYSFPFYTSESERALSFDFCFVLDISLLCGLLYESEKRKTKKLKLIHSLYERKNSEKYLDKIKILHIFSLNVMCAFSVSFSFAIKALDFRFWRIDSTYQDAECFTVVQTFWIPMICVHWTCFLRRR